MMWSPGSSDICDAESANDNLALPDNNNTHSFESCLSHSPAGVDWPKETIRSSFVPQAATIVSKNSLRLQTA
jgi:hypothetical protein